MILHSSGTVHKKIEGEGKIYCKCIYFVVFAEGRKLNGLLLVRGDVLWYVLLQRTMHLMLGNSVIKRDIKFQRETNSSRVKCRRSGHDLYRNLQSLFFRKLSITRFVCVLALLNATSTRKAVPYPNRYSGGRGQSFAINVTVSRIAFSDVGIDLYDGYAVWKSYRTTAS